MTEADEVAQQIAEFVLNHETHILDNIGDFGLLLPMLNVIKSYGESNEENSTSNDSDAQAKTSKA